MWRHFWPLDGICWRFWVLPRFWLVKVFLSVVGFLEYLKVSMGICRCLCELLVIMNNLGHFWVLAQPGSIFIQLLTRARRGFWSVLVEAHNELRRRPPSLLVTVSHASQLLLLKTAKSSLLWAAIIIILIAVIHVTVKKLPKMTDWNLQNWNHTV